MSEHSEVLVLLRKMAGLSQQELANKLGMTRSAISMYETGQREPSLEILEAFANFYKVDMNTLTGYVPIDETDKYGVRWAECLEEKLNHIGYSAEGEDDASKIWINCPDGPLYVTFEELEELNKNADNYLRFKIEELKIAKKHAKAD